MWFKNIGLSIQTWTLNHRNKLLMNNHNTTRGRSLSNQKVINVRCQKIGKGCTNLLSVQNDAYFDWNTPHAIQRDNLLFSVKLSNTLLKGLFDSSKSNFKHIPKFFCLTKQTEKLAKDFFCFTLWHRCDPLQKWIRIIQDLHFHFTLHQVQALTF